MSSVLGGGVLAVVEAADDVGHVHVAEEEPDEDLVVDLGDPPEAAVLAAHGVGQPAPVRLDLVREPGELDLDPPELLRVLVVRDHADHEAVDLAVLALDVPAPRDRVHETRHDDPRAMGWGNAATVAHAPERFAWRRQAPPRV
jgi:hypothetical protein